MMKRLAALAAALMLMIPAGGLAMTSGFTHPEMGELLTVKFDNGMPSFSIYDFPYYIVADPAAPLRGIEANFTTLPNKNMLDIDEALKQFFASFDKPEYSIYQLVYTGVSADYKDALGALPADERIEAVKLLNGFGGAGGYALLKGFAGFEGAEVDALAASHMDYHVKIGKEVYPYRVLSFHFEGDDWVAFTERYAFIQVKGKWKLSRTATEFTDDYLFRGKYIHGISGSEPAALAKINDQVLRSTAWGMSAQQVATQEGVSASADGVHVADVQAFRIPAKLDYSFGAEGLNEVRYTFGSREAYFSAFLSLYTRYSDPITIDEQANMTWSLNDMLVTLTFDEASPVVSFTPY